MSMSELDLNKIKDELEELNSRPAGISSRPYINKREERLRAVREIAMQLMCSALEGGTITDLDRLCDDALLAGVKIVTFAGVEENVPGDAK